MEFVVLIPECHLEPAVRKPAGLNLDGLVRDQGSHSLYVSRHTKNLSYAVLGRLGFCLPVKSLSKYLLSTPQGLGLSQVPGVEKGRNPTKITCLGPLSLPVLSIPKTCAA